jgi:hypothetical protein
MFDAKKLEVSGKLVRLTGIDVILDVSEKRDGLYSVDKVYQLDGTVVEDGDFVNGAEVNSKFMDALYDDLDRGRFWEI